jgi:hypothetical protein
VAPTSGRSSSGPPAADEGPPEPVRGARRTTYKLTRRDLGKIITCRTSATGTGGASTVISLGVLPRR